MDRRTPDYPPLPQLSSSPQSSSAVTLAYGIAGLYLIHQVLVFFDFAVLSPQEIFWNTLVYILPARLLLDHARRQELQATGMLSQTHAAKSEALRRIIGVGGNTVLQRLPSEGIMRRASMLVGSSSQNRSDAPPGLGNWDNSCYQNSVLQGLASLDSLKSYLGRYGGGQEESTTETLLETINKLNDPTNNGKELWTPAKLKSMSSWQQQDAQEYFSKIMDELEKESAKSQAVSQLKPGLETIFQDAPSEPPSPNETSTASQDDDDDSSKKSHGPMDGLLAQRVACTRCGFSEGLSMIPFNCLTVPLGSESVYSLEECLDEYTKLEEINDVECPKCTLNRAEQQITRMLPSPPNYLNVDSTEASPMDTKVLQLPPELRAQAFKRLAAIQQAIENDDFADKTLNENCQISKKARVSSTKTRQAVIGRAPQSLVVHVNRSVFDEMTGVQRKNYASVQFAPVLDLGAWMLNDDTSEGKSSAQSEATQSMLSGVDLSSKHPPEVIYRLKAVVTHYGRHENGHYICYRQHPTNATEDSGYHSLDEDESDIDATESNNVVKGGMQWWRLSDESVSAISEADVLKQGGVFMLFYEQEAAPDPHAPGEQSSIAAIETLPEKAVALAGSQDDDLAQAAAIPLPPFSDDQDGLGGQRDEVAVSTSSIDEPWSIPSTSQESQTPSTEPTTEDEWEVEVERQATPTRGLQTIPKSPTPPFMRTARGQQASNSENNAFGGNAFRAVAAG